MTPEELSKLDQSSALFVDYLAPHWRRLYLRLVDEGFAEQEAFELLKVYITATHSNRSPQ